MLNFKKIYNIFKLLLDFVPICALMGMLACVVIQVFTRYVIQIAVPWTQEAACYLLLLLCASGIIVTGRRGDHLGAFFLRDRFRGRMKPVLYLASSMVCFGYLSILIYGCFIMYSTQWSTMTGTTIPWYQTRWNYLIMAVGCAVANFYCARDFIWSIQIIIKGEEIITDGRSSPKEED